MLIKRFSPSNRPMHVYVVTEDERRGVQQGGGLHASGQSLGGSLSVYYTHD